MTRTIQFKSKKDCREFKIKVPESSSEDNENNDFIEINGKTRIVEEIFSDDPQREELLPPGENFTRHTALVKRASDHRNRLLPDTTFIIRSVAYFENNSSVILLDQSHQPFSALGHTPNTRTMTLFSRSATPQNLTESSS